MNSLCLGRELAEAEPRGKWQVTGFIVPSFDATLISLVCSLAGILQAGTLLGQVPQLPYRLSQETPGGRGGAWDPSRWSCFQSSGQHLAFILFCERRCGSGVIWDFGLLCCACEQGPYVRERSRLVEEQERTEKSRAAPRLPVQRAAALIRKVAQTGALCKKKTLGQGTQRQRETEPSLQTPLPFHCLPHITIIYKLHK